MVISNRQQQQQTQKQKRHRQQSAAAARLPAATHRVVMLLLLLVFVVFSAVWVPVQSLRTPVSIGSPHQSKRTGTATASTSTADRLGTVLGSTIPRGGSDGDNKPEKKDANTKNNNGEEDEAEEIEEIVEEIAQELVEDEEVEVEIGLEEEIVEEMEVEAEGVAEETEVEADEIEEEEEVVAVEEKEVAVAVEEENEEEEEEEVAVIYPTDEISSDDVRAFHTTDGELADDEGIYTDGQNESPIAVDENESEDEDEEQEVEAAADTESEDVDTTPNQAPITKTETSTATATNNDAVETVAAVTTIDAETKRILISELRYTVADVSQMRPEIAAEVVRNSLAKPTEGMPPSFYLDPTNRPTPSTSNKFWSTKKILLSVAGVAALSVGATALKDQENDVGESIEELIDTLKEIPEKIAALVAFVMNTRSKIETKASDTLDKIETVKADVAAAAAAIDETIKERLGEEEEVTSPTEQDTSVHSIRPGTKPEEIPDPDTDKTWLDKMLTGIERAIKSFLSIKI